MYSFGASKDIQLVELEIKGMEQPGNPLQWWCARHNKKKCREKKLHERKHERRKLPVLQIHQKKQQDLKS